MTRTLTGGDQDEALQGLMNDIVRGIRSKLVEPVISENRKLAGLLGDLHSKDQEEFKEIKARMDRLEEAVQAAPLLLLEAIKEAINQAGTDGKA